MYGHWRSPQTTVSDTTIMAEEAGFPEGCIQAYLRENLLERIQAPILVLGVRTHSVIIYL